MWSRLLMLSGPRMFASWACSSRASASGGAAAWVRPVVMFCMASMGVAVQSKPPGTLMRPHGAFGGRGKRSSILM